MDNEADSLTVQCTSKVSKNTERPETENGIQGPICETIGQQLKSSNKLTVHYLKTRCS